MKPWQSAFFCDFLFFSVFSSFVVERFAIKSGWIQDWHDNCDDNDDSDYDHDIIYFDDDVCGDNDVTDDDVCNDGGDCDDDVCGNNDEEYCNDSDEGLWEVLW